MSDKATINEPVDEKNIQQSLIEPFEEDELCWRIGHMGWTKDGRPWAMVLAYIDARAAMDRLDSVFGIGGWYDKYRKEETGLMCDLSCKINGEWITKTDGAEPTAVESYKGNISDAFKRAAVKYGVGRYLYTLKENFASVSLERKAGWNKHYDKKEKKAFFWHPPELPERALPSRDEKDVTSAEGATNYVIGGGLFKDRRLGDMSASELSQHLGWMKKNVPNGPLKKTHSEVMAKVTAVLNDKLDAFDYPEPSDNR